MSETLAKKQKRLARKPRRKTEIVERQTEKSDRLERIKNKALAEKIRQTEKEWTRLALALDRQQCKDRKTDLLAYPIVVNLIKGASKRWGICYNDRRLSQADFFSAFYEEVWNVIMEYSWHDSSYLYEQMKKAIQSRGKDMLRATKRDRRWAFHDSLSLSEGFEDFYPDGSDQLEDIIMLKLYKEGLTDLEQELFNVMNNGGSQREAAKELSKNRRTINKALRGLQEKYAPYRSAS